MDILEQLQELVREVTGDQTIVAERDSLLRGSLGLDSYTLVSLLSAAEDRFGVEIPDRTVQTLLTVGDVVDFFSNAV